MLQTEESSVKVINRVYKSECQVCHKSIKAAYFTNYLGRIIYFCSKNCLSHFNLIPFIEKKTNA